MIARDLAPLLRRAAATVPVVMLMGPRQSGKTTLCRALFPRHVYRTLEAPDARALALGDPRSFLAELPDGAEGAIIDEIQRAPELLSCLQGIMDDDPAPGRWILAGSQDLLLPESIGQSLAGRSELHKLLPLAWGEIQRFARPPASLDEALLTGGYPEILDHAVDPTAWLRTYAGRYVDRDVRTMVNVRNLATFQRFVGLCASRTGQFVNYSSLADGCGISQPTAKQWVDVLETSFIVFRLPAFHGNIRKRLVKAPKLYLWDTGLVCWLLGIHELRQLRSHPLRGPVFETWVVSEALKNRANRGLGRRGLTSYRDRHGVEADLVIDRASGRTTGRTLIEARSRSAPSSDMLRTIRRVRGHLPEPPVSDPVVVYGGNERQRWADGELLPWRMVRAAALRDGAGVVQVHSGGRPVATADVLVASPIHPNVRWKSARTDARGEAILELDPRHRLPGPIPGPSVPLTLPLTLFVAAPGFEAWLEREWIPAERAIAIDLARLPGGGGVIFPQGWGDIPGLAGRVTVAAGDFLSPFGRTFDTARIRAENIAINGEMSGEMSGDVSGEPQRPVYIRPGHESPLIHLEDDAGSERWIRVLKIVGRSVLVEYRDEPPGSPREAPARPRGQGSRVRMNR
ncbi:ATP-binding protein [Candidatus Palauibacter sp.]|uniref:ATP-binding protein n=1 Tax=Candidatus Palauibacter sp. TaxID=3101350 RepID=UPI003B019C6A